jgi:hypothetical protein
MSTKEGGITSWADKDGSFKRQVSSFRDRIEEGGKFAPEKGKSLACTRGEVLINQDDITYMSDLLVHGLIVV